LAHLQRMRQVKHMPRLVEHFELAGRGMCQQRVKLAAVGQGHQLIAIAVNEQQPGDYVLARWGRPQLADVQPKGGHRWHAQKPCVN
jgi:hypothetical protein